MRNYNQTALLNIKEKEIIINGLKVNYKIAGEENRGAREAGGWREGCSLLILHGWGGSSNSWVFVQKILANQGFRVICPDLPGFGKTPSPIEPWEIKNYSNFILNFIGKLSLEKITLLGHSFGGRIAIKFATFYPEKLKTLILCASAGIKKEMNFRQKIIFYIVLVGNFILSKEPFRRIKDVATNIFYSLIRQNDYTKVKGAMKETFKKVVDEDLVPDLSKIQNKTLIIWGEKDKSVPLKDAFLFKEKIKNSVLETIPKVGHTPNLEFPEKLAEIIIKFLKT